MSCAFEWGDGQTFGIEQEFRRDGTLVAELHSVGGVTDLRERRLVPDPHAVFRELSSDTALPSLGL